jgi:flagellar FliL protein
MITKERIIMAEAVENTEVQVERKGGSNVLLIVIASVLALLLIGGGAAAYFLLNEDEEVLNDANRAVQTQAVAQNKSASSKKSTSRATNYAEIGKMYPMEQFIVNLYSENGSRYLKTTLNFELAGEELAMELDTKKPLIRDIIIKSLSAKTYEEVSTMKGKENLKDEIVLNVNEVISDGQINNLFFTDFVIQ